MLDQMMLNLTNQLRPGAVVVAETAKGYAEEILQSLDRIENELRNEEFLELRKRFTVVIPAGGLVAEAFTVPANEEWALEVITSNMSVSGSYVLFQDPNANVGGTVSLAGKAVEYAASPGGGSGSGAGALATNGGAGIVFEGNTQILAAGIGTAAGVLRIQVRVKTHKAVSKAKYAGGDPERRPYLSIAHEEDTARHTTPGVYEGVNPRGERKALNATQR